jgi:capsid protein
MNTREKFINWITGGALAKIQARYEAAHWSTTRSYLPENIQGAREDINSMSRLEILRRVRHFEKNSNVMQKALSILSVNVVGSGINPTPATSKDAWNKAALDWWNSWANVADITGTSSLYEMQDIVFRAQNIDGDHGIELTENEFGRPALNLVEAHRIGSGGIDIQRMVQAGYNVSDGVILSPAGKPLAYMVQNEFTGKSTATIPASQFVFFFTKRRAGQYRGLSLFHAAIVDLHDLDDLQKYEMRAAKDQSALSKAIETAAGGFTNGSDNAIGASLNTPTGQDPAARVASYREAIGGETIVTQPGDKIQFFETKRPSAAMSGFWDKLENKFVQGSGLSYAALVDYRGNWGGATLRAAVTSDNRLFSLRTSEQARKWQRVWEYAISWAMAHGELEQNPEFRNVRWHPPRRTTVDVGNESASTLNELKAGTRTFETVYGEAGDDWRERLEQRAVEEKFISDLATKYGIDRALISSFAQERMTGIAPDASPDPNKKEPNA